MDLNLHKSRFKLFHELMKKKVQNILLISSSYEAWIMEEDARLSEKIINEYRGLNLSSPPRVTWVSSTSQAIESLETDYFDLVITISSTLDSNVYGICDRIKNKRPDMPVVLLTHQEALPEVCSQSPGTPASIDRIFFWSGNADILLAIVKSIEDQQNVIHDTEVAGIRVILFVEDSPVYLSSLLPIMYKALVIETQALIGDSLNEEHRLLHMRARPKILLASSFEDALGLYERFKPYVLGVFSDLRFPRNCILDSSAGLDLLKHIKHDRFDIPLLLTSSEAHNVSLAAEIPAVFVDKNSTKLHEEIKSFFMEYLGFGSFVFKMPDGSPIAEATDLYTLEQQLRKIPEESFLAHCRRNDFSRFFFSLGEIELASQVRPLRYDATNGIEKHRKQLIQLINEQRMERQRGVIVNFDKNKFDPETEFLKIGKGSLGGKARGLAFISSRLHMTSSLRETFAEVYILVPQTIVLTTEGFESFIEMNQLSSSVEEDLSDKVIEQRFLAAEFPETLRNQLRSFLDHIHYPLAVRSSSLLEDAQFKAYAGLYKTYMLPNDNEDLECRLDQLINAIKMVYASTYFEAPKAFSKRVGNRVENERMAVVIQRVMGSPFGNYYYPTLSGVAQSQNYYPFSKMKTDDGIARIALGLGRTVMEGGKGLRFCPRYPEILPEYSTVDDILKNSQRYFYALRLGDGPCLLGINDAVTLSKREITDAVDEYPIGLLSSTYDHEEHRIRDSFSPGATPVLTFTSILKHRIIPLPEILNALLSLGQEEFGGPVEIEFSVNFNPNPDGKAELAILQIRPMSAREEMLKVEITDEDRMSAFCISHQALGNTMNNEITDLVYVIPDKFDPAKSAEIATEIAQINAALLKENKNYILIGPGRWGSADPWLGIPVTWEDICSVGAIIETTHPSVNTEPSQGSHFFHNMITLGIPYFNILGSEIDRLDEDLIQSLPVTQKTAHVVRSTIDQPFTLKVDGRQHLGLLMISPS